MEKMTRNEKRLCDKLTKLSFASDWEIVRNEWDFEYEYEVNIEERHSCLCGKTPIKFMCVIKNQKTGVEAEVGSECVKNFLCMSEDLELYQVLKKLKDNISVSVNNTVLSLSYSQRVVNDWENNFYKDRMRKRKATIKQIIKKESINRKILNNYSKQFKQCPYLNPIL